MQPVLSKAQQYNNLRQFISETANGLTGEAGFVAHGFRMAMPACPDISMSGLRALAATYWAVVSRRAENLPTLRQLTIESEEARRTAVRERELARRDPANLIGAGAPC